MVLYVVGLYYDDFSEGGFSVKGIFDTEEKALNAIKDLREEFPSVAENFDYEIWGLNNRRF